MCKLKQKGLSLDEEKPSDLEMPSNHYAIRPASVFRLDLYDVFLDQPTMGYALEHAKQKMRDAKTRRMKDSFGQPSLQSHEIGAVCELAVRLLLNEPLTLTSGEGNVADIPPDIQVRGTRTQGEMKVRRKQGRYGDDPNWIVVGCIWWMRGYRGKPCVTVRGAMRAGYAQQRYPEEDKGDRGRPAHFVHWSSLSNLTPLLDKRRKTS